LKSSREKLDSVGPHPGLQFVILDDYVIWKY
jgi:hypothetical protein